MALINIGSELQSHIQEGRMQGEGGAAITALVLHTSADGKLTAVHVWHQLLHQCLTADEAVALPQLRTCDGVNNQAGGQLLQLVLPGQRLTLVSCAVALQEQQRDDGVQG